MSDRDELHEALAEYAHSAWSGWMGYLFSKCTTGAGGTVIMPQWAVERWERQASTPYAELPESERSSDREEAEKMLAIIAALPRLSAQDEPAKDARELWARLLYKLNANIETGPKLDIEAAAEIERYVQARLSVSRQGEDIGWAGCESAEELAQKVLDLPVQGFAVDSWIHKFDEKAVTLIAAHDAETLRKAADRARDWLICSDLYFMPEESDARNEDIESLRAAILGEGKP